MGNPLKNIFSWIIVITLPVIILLTSVEIAAFNHDFYIKEYEKYSVSQNTGIEEEGLKNITEQLLDYLKGRRQDLMIYEEVHGKEQLVFDERDQMHMVDVQVLFLKGVKIRNIAVILFVISFLTLVIQRENRRRIAKGIFLSGAISLSVIILLGIIISTDFSRYFDMFHYIFFDNDLWLLDPNKSILINLVPLGFFIDMAIRIGIYFLSTLGIFMVLSGMYLKGRRTCVEG